MRKLFTKKKKTSFSPLPNKRISYTSYPIVPKRPIPPPVPQRTYLNQRSSNTNYSNSPLPKRIIPTAKITTSHIPNYNLSSMYNNQFDCKYTKSSLGYENAVSQLDTSYHREIPRQYITSRLMNAQLDWSMESDIPVSAENSRRIDNWDQAIRSRIEMITKPNPKKRF